MKTEKQTALAAAEFVERWQGKGDEKSESQSFWTDLLQNVFGVEDVTAFITYEKRVKVDNTNFIDGYRVALSRVGHDGVGLQPL